MNKREVFGAASETGGTLLILTTLQRETMSGDPRAAFVDGVDTTKPNPVHHVKDTGIHGVGTGDPRAAWQSNSAVDEAAMQEEKDLRRAVRFSRPCRVLDPLLDLKSCFSTLPFCVAVHQPVKSTPCGRFLPRDLLSKPGSLLA